MRTGSRITWPSAWIYQDSAARGLIGYSDAAALLARRRLPACNAVLLPRLQLPEDVRRESINQPDRAGDWLCRLLWFFSRFERGSQHAFVFFHVPSPGLTVLNSLAEYKQESAIRRRNQRHRPESEGPCPKAWACLAVPAYDAATKPAFLPDLSLPAAGFSASPGRASSIGRRGSRRSSHLLPRAANKRR